MDIYSLLKKPQHELRLFYALECQENLERGVSDLYKMNISRVCFSTINF